MERRISNPFDYGSYLLLLSHDFANRVAINHSYSLRSYANDLGVSVGYLSSIINRKKNLSIKTGQKIFNALGFNEDELSYIINLIELDSTDDLDQKSKIHLKLRSRKEVTRLDSKFESTSINNSVTSFIVYGLIRKLKSFSRLTQVTDQLEIKQDEVKASLDALVTEGYLTQNDDMFEVTNQDFQIIQDHEGFCEFGSKIGQFLFEHYKNQGIVRLPDNVASNLILEFDQNSIKEVHEIQKQYILSLLKISERCQDPDKVVFVSNLFLEKEI